MLMGPLNEHCKQRKNPEIQFRHLSEVPGRREMPLDESEVDGDGRQMGGLNRPSPVQKSEVEQVKHKAWWRQGVKCSANLRDWSSKGNGGSKR